MSGSSQNSFEAIVVGSGPNGLAAALTLAMAGRSVLVREGQATIGGGTRTAELTLPGFFHDLCSAVHPLGIGSPYLRTLGLENNGLEWIHPALALAHPLDGGAAAVADRNLDETANGLGVDGRAWSSLFRPFAERWDELAADALAPLGLPRSPILMARFGAAALRSVDTLARSKFEGLPARALFAGIGAHSILPLDKSPGAAVAMMLGTALHANGWPIPKGGSQSIARALAARLTAAGGVIECGAPVRALSDLPPSKLVLFDLTPRQLLKIYGDALPAATRDAFTKFRYGPGVFKIDWALSGPVPWTNSACRKAGTLHLGGSLEELMTAEAAPWAGEHAPRPYVLFAQPTIADPTRAPPGKHVAWAYCHVPSGSTVDRTDAIEAQVERYAPGFRDLILARAKADCVQLEARNENLVGGDITGGVTDLRQLFFRPASSGNPYALPTPGHFMCSASTPPGAGVHGMCGHHAATAALKWLEKRR